MFGDTFTLFLSKLLPAFVYPLGLTLSLVAIAALLARLYFPRLAKLCYGTALAVLWVCSTPAVASWAVASLERQYPARSIAETPAADVAIVLGGAIGQPLPPRVTIDLHDAADRVLHAARLYRAGKVRHVLVSAGNIPWIPAVRSEAELIRDLLVEWGVAPAAIELGTASRNTYENAQEVERMLRARGFKSALLVTSASHMPRAMATFRRAGVPVVAATTDVSVVDSGHIDVLEWLPSADALAATTGAIKEWLGYWVYRVRGYL